VVAGNFMGCCRATRYRAARSSTTSAALEKELTRAIVNGRLADGARVRATEGDGGTIALELPEAAPLPAAVQPNLVDARRVPMRCTGGQCTEAARAEHLVKRTTALWADRLIAGRHLAYNIRESTPELVESFPRSAITNSLVGVCTTV
jgi:hypothetical protein